MNYTIVESIERHLMDCGIYKERLCLRLNAKLNEYYNNNKSNVLLRSHVMNKHSAKRSKFDVRGAFIRIHLSTPVPREIFIHQE